MSCPSPAAPSSTLRPFLLATRCSSYPVLCWAPRSCDDGSLGQEATHGPMVGAFGKDTLTQEPDIGLRWETSSRMPGSVAIEMATDLILPLSQPSTTSGRFVLLPGGLLFTAVCLLLNEAASKYCSKLKVVVVWCDEEARKLMVRIQWPFILSLYRNSFP
uniref:Uncharacterized protein n=1 Tax=Oryza sativa subsp. japonica TaxID=39947 RepID=Q6Z6S0_ORYSJ|nr:unknown protein [Oryza sativa Japonica Group]